MKIGSHTNSSHSKQLNIALLGLLWQFNDNIDALLNDIAMNNVNKLIKNATIKIHPFNYSDMLYCGLFDNKQKNLSTKYAKELDVHSRHDFFLLAEPTHLRLDRDRLLISEPELLQLSNNEAKDVIAIINQHFAPKIQIYYIQNDMWLVGFSSKNWDNQDWNSRNWDSSTPPYPIIDIIGENINNYLHPDNNIYLHQLLNEIQMLLFDSTININRTNLGLLTLNSLWFFDKKENSTLKNFFNQIYTLNPRICHKNNNISYIDDNIISYLGSKNLLIIDSLYYPRAYLDCFAWIQALEQFNNVIASKLLELIYAKQIKQVSIFVPNKINTVEIKVTKFSKFKFWKHTKYSTLISE